MTGSCRACARVRGERLAEPRFAASAPVTRPLPPLRKVAPYFLYTCRRLSSFAIRNKPTFAGTSRPERGSFGRISTHLLHLLLPDPGLCPWGRRRASATCHPRALGPCGTTVDRTLRSKRSGPEKCLGPGVEALRPTVMRPSWLPQHMPLPPHLSKAGVPPRSQGGNRTQHSLYTRCFRRAVQLQAQKGADGRHGAGH